MAERFPSPPEILRKINVEMLCPYEPGKPISEVKRELGLDRVIKLASNENPLGPSPHVLDVLQDTDLVLGEYPDNEGYDLRGALAAHLKISASELILGNGSADLMKVLADAFLAPGCESVIPDPSFPVYQTVTRIAGAQPVLVPVGPDLQIDLAAVASAVTERTRVLWLANPNNPTGLSLPWAAVADLIERLPSSVLTVLDVAYEDYADPAWRAGLQPLLRHPRVIVLKTFSKAYGLAGLRCGVCIARREHIEMMKRVRLPFSVNVAAQTAARAALEDRAHLDRTVALNLAERSRYKVSLDHLGLRYFLTAANFVLVDVGQDSSIVAQRLLRRGIIVRPIEHPRLKQMIRITTGTDEQNTYCLRTLSEVL